MQADMMRKNGRYEDAVTVIKEMKLIYEPQLHSKLIFEEYVSDHCAEIFLAASVSWLCCLNRKEEALKLCDYIVEHILPEIGEREFVSLTLLIYPICLSFKDQGKDKAVDALELYQKHVIQPTKALGETTHPAAALLLVPMAIILKCRSSDGEYASMKDDIAFMLVDGEEKYPAWIEAGAVSYFDVAFSTLYAESGFCLTKMDACDAQKSDALNKEGVRYLGISEATLKKEDGTITSAMAHSFYSHILSNVKTED